MPIFADIAKRVVGILFKPGSEWPMVAEESGAQGSFALINAAVFLTLPPLLLIVLGLIGIGFSKASAATVLTIGFAGLIATALLVLLLGAIARWAARSLDAPTDYATSFSFTIHATTPIWRGATLGNIVDPLQRPLAVLAFVWAIVLVAKGATAMLGIAREKRGLFTYTFAFSQLVLWLLLGAVRGIALAALGGDVAAQLTRTR